jgi:fermentation-respiration switch protein FrsA (DUF1100 family)
MPGAWREIDGPAGALAVHVAGADPVRVLAGRSAGTQPVAPGHCLVVCPGLPVEVGAAERTGRTFPALADRLAAESGWCVVGCCLRGLGPSAGDFALDGWVEDLAAVVALLAPAVGGAVWLAGFGIAGSVALWSASGDDRVRGVATLGAPAGFSRWTSDPVGAVNLARRVGAVHDAPSPEVAERWLAAARRVDPLAAARSLAGRTLLVVHGTEDDVVPVDDARSLAAAAGTGAELRLLAGAGHRLRADPRAIALLLGWLDRQGL